MSEAATRRRRASRLSVALLFALVASLVTLTSAQATADEPKVPEDVAAYFATGLVPRLADLYGSPGSNDPASTFDETTKVGTIHRLLAWTPEFLAGQKTDSPTQLTNTWIAPVTAKEGTILGLAAVWINPGDDEVELADFSRGRALVDALGRAPKDTQLINDTAQQAWFATDGKTLTPLVAGSSGTHGPLTSAEYQKILESKAGPAQAPEPVTNPGLLIAGITLGAVVLLLAVFILLPGRRRKTEAGRDAVARPRRNPRDESDKAFDREASLTEARAVSRARAAVAAEAGLVDAIAESEARPGDAKPKRAFEPDDAPPARRAAPASRPEPAAQQPVQRTVTAPSERTPKAKPAASEPAGQAATGKPATGKAAAKKPSPSASAVTPASAKPRSSPKATTPKPQSAPSSKPTTAKPSTTRSAKPKTSPVKQNRATPTTKRAAAEKLTDEE